MRKEFDIPSIYVDGVIKYHKELEKVFLAANDVALKYAPDKAFGLNPPASNACLFVDFSEPQPANAIRGYLCYSLRIIRFITFEIDYAALFPVVEHNFKNVVAEGLTYQTISQLKDARTKLKLFFRGPKGEREKFYPISLSRKGFNESVLRGTDDLGKPFNDFDDISQLQIKEIPDQFLRAEYTLVGQQFYAPYTKGPEIHCALLAEKDNEYDQNAIKVLRWFPQTREKAAEIRAKKGMWVDMFYELGYISRQENKDLHDFMMNNNSRLLFGTLTNSRISVKGGIKIFLENDYNLPMSLSKIKFI